MTTVIKMPELMKNEIFTARTEGYTAQGHGVCRILGRAVFVPGAMENELWEVRILRVTSASVWGRGEKLLEPSPDRIEPDCDAFPRCGGCALRHMDYTHELDMKLRRVNDAIARIGKLDFTVSGILGAEGDAFHRRKVIFNVGELGGKPIAGFYRSRSHEIVSAEDCPAVPAEAMTVRRTVLDWMERRGVPAYDEASGRDGVRHIFYRSSALTGKCVVTLTTSSEPQEADLAALRDMLRLRCPAMTGLVLNLNRSRGNTVLAGEFRTVWGSAELTEGLCGLRFSLSPRSFFQVNPPQAEKLYEKALEYADAGRGALALDLYCGTGTIGLCMASRGARVIGAEIVSDAVKNARENAERNFLSDLCEFICADASQAAEELRRRGLRPEVIVVDPPRKGLAPEVIDAAVGMEPDRIVYVSCDPGTLARDLAVFAAKGYSPAAGTAVDMFPRTSHIETVVQLSKGNISSRNVRVEFSLEDMDMSRFQQGATYEQIQAWVQEKYGFHVTHLNIAKTKWKCGIIERENYNFPKSEDSQSPKTPKEKEETIIDAFLRFKMM